MKKTKRIRDPVDFLSFWMLFPKKDFYIQAECTFACYKANSGSSRFPKFLDVVSEEGL